MDIQNDQINLEGMNTKIDQINENNIWREKDGELVRYNNINTKGGQSGSGIWFKEDGNNKNDNKYFIFAIHNGAHLENKYNQAV